MSSSSSSNSSSESSVSLAVGWIGVAAAIFFFGTFAVPVKFKRVKKLNVDPMVYQLYYSVAVFLTSWLILTYNSFQFTYWGIVGAALWVPSSVLAIFAIKFLGIGIAQGLWSGTTIIVSFIWGSVYFKDPIKDWIWTIFGLLLLIVGMLGIALCSYSFKSFRFFSKQYQNNDNFQVKETNENDHSESKQNHANIESSSSSLSYPSSSFSSSRNNQDKDNLCDFEIETEKYSRNVSNREEEEEEEQNNVNSSLRDNSDKNLNYNQTEEKRDENDDENEQDSSLMKQHLLNDDHFHDSNSEHSSVFKDKMLGLGCTLALGLMNGSMMVPARLATAGGIVYVVSFSIGVIAVTPLLAILYFIVRRQRPQFHFKGTIIPGLLTGTMWNIGNVATTYASISPLGLTIGFPLTQTSLLVGGLWGLILFRELKGFRSISQFFISALILLGGGTLLAIFGKGDR